MRISRLVAAVAVTAVVAVPVVPAQANAPTKDTPRGSVKGGSDNLRLPFQVKQDALKQHVLEQKVKGEISPLATVAKVAKKRYVNLENEGTDRIFVVLAEFGDTRHASYPDNDPTTGDPASDAQKFDGPAHNEIPKPDRSVDNSTLWQKDYNKAHYTDMYFNRMDAYFQRESSGRYAVDGAVADWVKVPFNEARYGRDFCGDIVCNNTWALIRDAMADLDEEPARRRHDDAGDQGLPGHVRQAGPLRHRRRRRLQRAGRLHRPLPDRARRRRPGCRRPDVRL